jgi:hypothetical protein
MADDYGITGWMGPAVALGVGSAMLKKSKSLIRNRKLKRVNLFKKRRL